MTRARLAIYLAVVVAGVAVTLDALRRLVDADYVWWSVEALVAVVLALSAHWIRIRRPRVGRRDPGDEADPSV